MESVLPEDVQREFDAAIAAGDEKALLRLVDANESEGSSAVARKLLEQARTAFSDSSRLAVRTLEFYTRYKDWRAIDAFAESTRSDVKRSAGVQFAFGCAYELQRRWEDATSSFRDALRMAPNDVEPLIRLTRALRVQGRSKEAAKVLEAHKKHHKKEAPVFAALGYAKIETGDPEAAATYFRKATVLQPDWGPYLDDLAGALMLCERWQEAAQVATASLKRRKKNERAWTVFAVAHQHLGVPDRAEQGFKNAVRAARNPSRAKGNYGLFLRNNAERLLEAARLLKEAHEAHPEWEEVDHALRALLATES